MRAKKVSVALAFLILMGGVFSQPSRIEALSVTKLSDSEVLLKDGDSDHRCQIDQDVVETQLSSDTQALIISGTSYVLVSDLLRCNASVAIHAKKAAPHVGFLADVNLSAGIYASLIPVSVQPMSFVAVVAKLGSDRNLIKRPGFYRTGVSRSRILSEASTNMSLTLSVDARYVSLDLHTCDSVNDRYVSVVEIVSGKNTSLSREICEKIFHFQ